MNKYQIYITLFTIYIFLSIGCSTIHKTTDRILEFNGNIQLKQRGYQKPNYYIGISKPLPSLQQAMENAQQNAEFQLLQYLGTTIDTHILYHEISSDTVVFNKTEVKIEQKAKHWITIKPSSTYWEKHESSTNNCYYLVWVEIPFEKEQYSSIINQAFTNIASELLNQAKYESTNNYPLASFQLLNKACEYDTLWQSYTDRNFTQGYQLYQSAILSILNKVITEKNNFSIKTTKTNSILLCELYHGKSRILPVPLKLSIDNKCYNYTKPFDLPKSTKPYTIVISLNYPAIEKKYPDILPTTTLAINALPNRASFKLQIVTDNEAMPSLANDISIGLTKLGYVITKKGPYQLHIHYACQPANQPSPMVKIWDVHYSLYLQKDNTILWSYDLPNADFTTIHGYGENNGIAKKRAIDLLDFTQKNRLVSLIIGEVDTCLLQKK